MRLVVELVNFPPLKNRRVIFDFQYFLDLFSKIYFIIYSIIKGIKSGK